MFKPNDIVECLFTPPGTSGIYPEYEYIVKDIIVDNGKTFIMVEKDSDGVPNTCWNPECFKLVWRESPSTFQTQGI